MGGMDDLIAFLRDRYAETAARALAATRGPWAVDSETYAESISAADGTLVVSGGRWGGEASVFKDSADAIHIAEHDPARVLAEIDAKRRLLDDILRQDHERNEEDTWYSCAALFDETGELLSTGDLRAGGPCTCGRDRAVERRIRLLALPYADHPDYLEKWRPAVS